MYGQVLKKNNTKAEITDIFCKVNGEKRKITFGYAKKNGQWINFFRGFEVPLGTIVAFEGLLSDIPQGWVLCDGQNGTPDLRDRIIRGADVSTANNIGGSTTHTHSTELSGDHTHSSVSTDGHRHDPTSTNKFLGSSVRRLQVADPHSHSISGGSHSHTLNSSSNMPPYYKLAFIMKVGDSGWGNL